MFYLQVGKLYRTHIKAVIACRHFGAIGLIRLISAKIFAAFGFRGFETEMISNTNF